MRSLGVTVGEVDIRPTATTMLREMGHPFGSGEPVYDVTFENVQAGLRTDYLFRIANQRGGIVLGTGDLSELALGWSTYGVGDQMSHYNVNGGIPKTFIQHLIRWVISTDQFDDDVEATLGRILDTEISPELVPGDELQSTESKVGPYALQDFALFHVLRYGFRPGPDRVPRLACVARRGGRSLAAELPGRRSASRTTCPRSGVARGVLPPLLRVRAVQAVRDAERPEGAGRRLAVAARRLACPLRRLRDRLARRSRALGRRRRLRLTRSTRSP